MTYLRPGRNTLVNSVIKRINQEWVAGRSGFRRWGISRSSNNSQASPFREVCGRRAFFVEVVKMMS